MAGDLPAPTLPTVWPRFITLPMADLAGPTATTAALHNVVESGLFRSGGYATSSSAEPIRGLIARHSFLSVEESEGFVWVAGFRWDAWQIEALNR
jgi:hypothetical protein